MFVELTRLSDGMKVAIRAETICRVYDVGEEEEDGAVRPPHTLVVTIDGDMIRCTEDYSSVMESIRLCEL